ncbi:MAG: hypothetical protein R3F61_00460 [Myxococcota bacterium]
MARRPDQDDVELETADLTLEPWVGAARDAVRQLRRQQPAPAPEPEPEALDLDESGYVQLDAEPDLSLSLQAVALPAGTTSAEARGFVVAAVTVALVAFDIAFNLAVYGDIFFDNYVTVWTVGVSVILASAILPATQRPIGCAGAVVLALPTLYFPGAFLTTMVVSRPLGETVLGIVATVLVALMSLVLAGIYLVTLPYVMLTLARVLDPTIIEVPTVRMRLGLGAIALAMALAGAGLGLVHPWWLTCDDFRVSGRDPPSNCTPQLLE